MERSGWINHKFDLGGGRGLTEDDTFGARRDVEWDAIKVELRRVADLSPLMVWITEADGYCIYLNQRWYDFTGQAPNEGTGVGWVNAVHKDDREGARTAFLSAASNATTYHVEYRLCRHDSAYEWVHAVGHPFFNNDGQLGGYIGSDAAATHLGAPERKGVLTAREREVVIWISKGKTSAEIAKILGIAQRTVDQHATSSMLKLGASNRVHTAVEAMRLGEINI